MKYSRLKPAAAFSLCLFVVFFLSLRQKGSEEVSTPDRLRAPLARNAEPLDLTEPVRASPHLGAREASLTLEGFTVAWAQQHRQRMKQLIHEDPEQALAEMLPLRLREELPEEVRAELPELIVGRGFFGKKVLCNHSEADLQRAAMDPLYVHPVWEHEYVRELHIAGRQYQAHVYGEGLNMQTDEDAAVFGVAVDDHVVLHEDRIQVLPVQEVPLSWLQEVPEGLRTQKEAVVMLRGEERKLFASQGDMDAWLAAEAERALEPELDVAAGVSFTPGTPLTSDSTPPVDTYVNEWTGSYNHQLGPKTVMVFVVKPSDGSGYSASDLPSHDNLIDGLDHSSAWYYEQSYKQTWFGNKTDNYGDVYRLVVTPELDLPGTIESYKDFDGGLQSAAKSATEALGGDWTNNGPKDPDRFDRWVVMSKDKLIRSTGLAYVGGKLSWVGNSLQGGVATHEWGHNWGLYHENYWDGNSHIPRNGLGTHSEYGETGGNFNEMSRYKIRWLLESDGDIEFLSQNGTYTRRLFSYGDSEADKPSTRLRSIGIPITDKASRYLTLGYRPLSNGIEGGDRRVDRELNGLQIHADGTSTQDSGWNRGTHFIDATPGSRPEPGFQDQNDGILLLGRTYSEPANLNGNNSQEIHITPVLRGSFSEGGDQHPYLDVVVNLGDFSSNQSPAASISTSNAQLALGETAILNAVASDPDGDPLAYAWEVSDLRYSTSNNSSYALSFDQPGLYEVTLTVSDMKGGTATAVQWINVDSQPTYAANPPAQNLSGLNYRYYETAASLVPDFEQLYPQKSGTVSQLSLSPREREEDIAFWFEGYVDVPATDIYTFILASEDGAILEVAGQEVVNNDGLKSLTTEVSGAISLEAGLHPVRVRYFHKSGNPELKLYWRSVAATGNSRVQLSSANFRQADPAQLSVPQVSISSPGEGASFPLDTSVPLQATASDPDGISKVVFFVNDVFVGEDRSAPYEASWDELILGSHEVKVIAYDSMGQWKETAPVSITIENEFRNFIGLNIIGSTTPAEGELQAAEVAGAVYAGGNWNNVVDNNSDNNGDPDTLEGQSSGLMDTKGDAVSTRLIWDLRVGKSSGQTYGENNADISTPNGKLMRGFSGDRDSGSYARYEIEDIPFLQYDVYVYFDHRENRSGDRIEGRYELLPTQGAAPPAKYGKNSLATNDSVGDYPNYDTWTGFKEASAESSGRPNAELLGNYVVFRNQTSPATRLITGRISGADFPSVAAIQIVESPLSISRAVIGESDSSTTLSESGVTDTLELSLSLPPANGSVALRVTPDAQMQVNPQVLVFNAGNYDVPQTVTVSAVNDSVVEGEHQGMLTLSLLGLENYADRPEVNLPVSISDDDQAEILVQSQGTAEESPNQTALFRIVRRGLGDVGSSLTVPFTLSGSAATDGSDYSVSGSGVSYSTGTAAGSLLIPAGAISAEVLITPVNDALEEGLEEVVLSLGSVTPHVLTQNSARLSLLDDDAPLYLAQHFDDGAIWGSRGGAATLDDSFDLNRKRLTFTPDASPGYYAVTVSDASSFEESTLGHSRFFPSNYWNDLYLSGANVSFYGTQHDTVTIDSWGTIVFGQHISAPYTSLDPGSTYYLYRYKQLAFFGGTWLAPEDSNGSGLADGDIHYHRAADRFIITFTDVTIGTGGSISCQMIFRDNGIITVTYIDTVYTGTSGITVGLSNLTETVNSSVPPADAMLPGFREFDFSAAKPSTTPNEPPSFATLPLQLAEQGQTYSYTVSAWDPEGDAVTLSAATKPSWLSFTASADGGLLSGTPPSMGSYSVLLEAEDGTNAAVQQSFSIQVQSLPGSSGPVILSQPQSQSRPYHSSAGFVVVARGDDPMSYQWRKDGIPLAEGSKYSGTDTATLTVNTLEETDEGSFDVLLNNGLGGDVLSSAAALLVDAPIAPSIVEQPDGLSLQEGDSLSLAVVAEGSPTLRYQWFVQGNPLSDGGNISGSATATLLIVDAAAGDGSSNQGNNGSYTVEISNDGGSIISSAALVTVTPLVILPPDDLSASALNDKEVDLSWSDASDNETGYRIERADNAAGPWSAVTTLSADSSSYRDSGLPPETTYFYRVIPFRNSIDGPASNVSFATTQGEPIIAATLLYHFDFDDNGGSGSTVNDVSGYGTAAHATAYTGNPPMATSGMFAPFPAPGDGLGINFSASRSNLQFDQSKFNSDVGGVSNAFTVMWSMDLSGISSKGLESQSFLEVTDSSDDLRISAANTNLSALRLYVQIDGTAASTSSGFDASAGMVVAVAYDAGTDELQVFVGDSVQTLLLHETVTLNETAVPDLNSVLRFGDTSSGSPRGLFDDIRIYDQALNRSTLRAIDAPPAPVPAETLQALTQSSSQIDLNWNDVSSTEDGFKVQRAPSSSGPWTTLITTAADATQYSDNSVSSGTAYVYRVLATNAGGDAAPSNEAFAMSWTEQQQYFADSGLAYNIDPTVDTDGDGLRNEDEVVAGTNPNSADSSLKSNMALPVVETFAFRFPSVNGKFYRVFYRESLTTGNWQPLSGYENLSGSGAMLQVEDSPEGIRFYRVQVQGVPW